MTTKPRLTPQDKGALLLDRVTSLGDNIFAVDSSDGWFYMVWPRTADTPAHCQCPAYKHGKGERCKHLWAVRKFIEAQRPKF